MNEVLGRVAATVQSQLARFRREDEGATAVEYGLIIALISVVVIGGALALGGAVSGAFTNVATAVTNAPNTH